MEKMKAGLICKECEKSNKSYLIKIAVYDKDQKSMRLLDAAYCDNCGRGTFDLNELSEAITDFEGKKNAVDYLSLN
jgi:hypothetical protein